MRKRRRVKEAWKDAGGALCALWLIGWGVLFIASMFLSPKHHGVHVFTLGDVVLLSLWLGPLATFVVGGLILIVGCFAFEGVAWAIKAGLPLETVIEPSPDMREAHKIKDKTAS